MKSKLEAPLNKIIRFSNVDGPGNRMAIFFQECNFNCLYCHNPETINLCISCGKCIDVCPVKALSRNEQKKVIWDSEICINCDKCIKTCENSSSPKIKIVDSDYLLNEIKKVKSFIKGITVSGGESSLRYEFLTELFTKVKKEFPNLTCFVDTNGGLDFSQEKYREFLDITDAFMLDIKGWKNSEHLNITTKDNINPIKNLYYLKEIGKLYEVRTVIVPNILECENIVKNVARVIGDTDIRYKIIKYRSIGVRKENIDKLSSPSIEYLKNLEEIAKNLNVNIIVM